MTSPNEAQRFSEDLLLYASGELDDARTAELEARLEQDEALRREAEWLTLLELTAASRPRVSRRGWSMAAAALLLAGVAGGWWGQRDGVPSPDVEPAVVERTASLADAGRSLRAEASKSVSAPWLSLPSKARRPGRDELTRRPVLPPRTRLREGRTNLQSWFRDERSAR